LLFIIDYTLFIQNHPATFGYYTNEMDERSADAMFP